MQVKGASHHSLRKLTRQTCCAVHPFEQLSDAQFSAVVGMAGQHYLAHLHL